VRGRAMARLRRVVHGRAVGLLARYYRTGQRRELVKEVVEAPIDFTWSSPPYRGLRLGSMAVEWRGLLKPPYTGEYRVIIRVSWGHARLYLGNYLLVEGRAESGGVYSSQPLRLTAGVYYPIRVEFMSSGQRPGISLMWLRSDGLEEVVPRDSLYTYTSRVVRIRGVPESHNVELWSVGRISRGVVKGGEAVLELPDTPPPFEVYVRVVDPRSGRYVETNIVKDMWGGDVYELLL